MYIPNTKGTVIVGATESDCHVVSIFLVSQMLEENGYNVINMSCCNSISSLFKAVDENSNVVGLVLSNQNGQALDDISGLRFEKQRARTFFPIILGGHHFVGCHGRAEYEAKLMEAGVDHIVTSMDELTNVLDAFHTPESHAEETISYA